MTTQKPTPTMRYNLDKLISKLKRDSPVRLWIQTHRDAPSPDAMTLLQTLSQCDRCSWRDRAVAFHFLGSIELSPPEHDHAVRLLKNAFTHPEIERNSPLQWLGALGYALLFWYLFCIVMSLICEGHLFLPDPLILLFPSALFMAVRRKLQKRQARIITKRVVAAALTSVGNPLCIEPLYQEVRASGAAEPEARTALKTVMRTVSGEWYGHLPPGTEAALIYLAEFQNPEIAMVQIQDPDLTIAALDALELTGGGVAVKAVERLAIRLPNCRVQRRATEVLPILLARREQERAASTLLRPSAIDPAEHLVRPVCTSDPDTTNLLRASQPEGTISFGEPDRG